MREADGYAYRGYKCNLLYLIFIVCGWNSFLICLGKNHLYFFYVTEQCNVLHLIPVTVYIVRVASPTLQNRHLTKLDVTS